MILHKLLSSCPVLEDLFVEQDGCESEHFLEAVSVIVPSLQRLTLKICRGSFFKALVMNTPSLKYFKFTDYTCEHHDFSDTDIDFDFDYNGYSFYSDDMPKLEEMEVDSTYLDTENFVSLITHVKRLSLCLPDQAENEKVTCFNPSVDLSLEHPPYSFFFIVCRLYIVRVLSSASFVV